MNDNVEAIYGLTPMQEGMLYQNFLNKDDTSYHIQNSFWMNQEVDIKTVEKVLKLLCIKHEVFRTAFVIPKTTGIPWQVILRNRNIEFDSIKGSLIKEREFIENIKTEDLKRGFDLEKDSLLRVKIIAFEENKNLILFSFHHIVMDGWCLSIVFNDFITFYKDLKSEISYEDIENEIIRQRKGICNYSNYIEWLKTRDMNEGIKYWEELLKDYDEEAVIKPLKKSKVSSEQMRSVKVNISKDITKKVHEVARGNNVTVNTIAEVAWGILLQKANYIKDVVFGKVISGRGAPLDGIENKVGLFINSIPIRITNSDETTIIQLIKDVYNQGIKSSSYEFCSLSEIQNLTLQGSKLIQTAIVFENYNEIENSNDIGIQFYSAREQTGYPISVRFAVQNNSLSYSIMYNPNEFIEEEIKRISRWLENIFGEIANNYNNKVTSISMISRDETNKILKEFNKYDIDYTNLTTIVKVFEEQVSKTPNNIAIVYDKEKISYYDLNQKINCIARELISKGIKKGDFIGILAKSNIETIASIYGVIKSGGAYVPIDPEFPLERIKYILEDCKAKIILVKGESPFSHIESIDINEISTENKMFDDPEVLIDPNDIAYCIYTSGTTGKPKGVIVRHCGVPNLRDYFINELNINEEDNILQFSNIVFDASVWEMTMSLLIGGRLIIATEEERQNEEKFIKLAKKESISVATLPPIFLNSLQEFNPRLIITAGSESSREMVKKASRNSEYINAYGPTEFTVATTYWKYDNLDIPIKIPIGKPISNTKVYILDCNNICGIGVPGELCMTGIGLAKGYLNKEYLTEKKFVKNPFGDGVIYKSGDLARWLPDGNIEYLRRIDDQVKIRGFRIELGDIESAIKNIENIDEAVAIQREDKLGEKELCAYLVSKDEIDIFKVKKELEKVLPSYMIPKLIMQIESIPVTINGKLNKRLLPVIEFNSIDDYVAPRNEQEKIICSLFSEILCREKVSIDDQFFQLGGDSLKGMRLISKIRSLGYNLQVNELFKYQSARNLSEKGILYKSEDAVKLISNEENIIKFNTVKEIKKFHKDVISKYNRDVLGGNNIKDFKLSSIQNISINKNILKSGFNLEFDHEINLNKILKVLLEIINSQEMLRAILIKVNDSFTIQVKDLINNISIPIIDISMFSLKKKKEFDNYITRNMFEREKWEEVNLCNKLLYELMIVKKSKNSYVLYMSICHLIFDGMSADILKSKILKGYYDTKDLYIEKCDEQYSKYADAIKEGLHDILEDKLIDVFDLKEFSNNVKSFKNISLKSFVNAKFCINFNKPIKEISEKELWARSYMLFYKLICFNFNLDKVPAFVLITSREYKEINYYNTIGEFLDIIPVTDSTNMNFDIFQRILKYSNNNGINFSELIDDNKSLEEYPLLVDIREKINIIPVFNFTGFYDYKVDKQLEKYIYNKDISTVVDVSYNDTEIIIDGFCIKGKEEELKELLQELDV